MIGRICLQMLRIHGGRIEKRSACKKDSKNSSTEFENVTTKWSRKDAPSKKSTNQQALTNILSIMAKCANQWVLILKVRVLGWRFFYCHSVILLPLGNSTATSTAVAVEIKNGFYCSGSRNLKRFLLQWLWKSKSDRISQSDFV